MTKNYHCVVYASRVKDLNFILLATYTHFHQRQRPIEILKETFKDVGTFAGGKAKIKRNLKEVFTPFKGEIK